MIKFERTFDEKMAGKFRSHFYKEFHEQLLKMESFKGFTYNITMPNQTLVLDVNGDPFELVHLPKELGTYTCKITPYLANFTSLGFTEEEAQRIVDKATAAAKAM